MTTLRMTLLTALVAAAGGCHSRPAANSPFSDSSSAAILTVQNNNWLDVVVYVVEGGSRTSVLRAGTNRTVTMALPASLVKNGVNLRLVADFVGAMDDYWSQSVFVRPGQQLSWTLEDDLQYSSLWIY